jgi:capsular exopolysaccharide synthesis family protein
MISCNVSIAMAQSGLRTVIIDADLRRPRMHKAFGMENTEGLVDLLTTSKSIEDVAQESGVENLHVITSGAIPPNPSELLHGPTFQKLVDALREQYDRVIFDSPPMGAVSDPIIISRSVDGTLLVLMFGKTRRELLRRSIEQLVTVGAPLLGCVLNNIDVNRSGYYGYSYYRYNYEDSPTAGS